MYINAPLREDTASFMTFVKFVDTYGNSVSVHHATFVLKDDKQGVAVKLRVVRSTFLFLHDRHVVLATRHDAKTYRTAGVFFLDASGNVKCTNKTMEAWRNSDIARMASSMLTTARASSQNMYMAMGFALIVVYWTNVSMLHLIAHAIETMFHLGAFMVFHFLMHVFAITVPVTQVHVNPAWNGKAFATMVGLFCEINVAAHLVMHLCYVAFEHYPTSTYKMWFCMGAMVWVRDCAKC